MTDCTIDRIREELLNAVNAEDEIEYVTMGSEIVRMYRGKIVTSEEAVAIMKWNRTQRTPQV